jgi:hypothetical protein
MRRVAACLAVLQAGCLPACSRSGGRSNGGIADADLSTVEITLERTACFGICPEYTVWIQADGAVHYDGTSYVVADGERDGRISVEAVRSLVERFQETNFFEMRDEYTQPITDLPGMILTLKVGERTKHVLNYGHRRSISERARNSPDEDVQEALFVLGDAIDEVVGSDQWIGSIEERVARQNSRSQGQGSAEAK